MPRVLIAVLIVIAVLAAPSAEGAEGLGDFIFDKTIESMKKAGVGKAFFPHTLHEKYDQCNTCHPGLFVAKRGENFMTMEDTIQGRYCGAPGCHNGIKSFPLWDCIKCHEKP